MFARGSRLLQYSHLTPNFAKSQTLAPLFHYQQTRPVLANSHRHYASSPKFDVNNNKTEMKQEWSQELIQVTQQVVDLTKADKLTTTQCNSLIRNLRQLEEYNKMFKDGPTPNSETYTMLKEAAEKLDRKDWAEQLAKKI